MINARAQNAYGVAHFAQQNHVPQVRWENVDIIGQYLDNMNKQKQLEMIDKNYELAKDQAALDKLRFDENVRQFNIGQENVEWGRNNITKGDALKLALEREKINGLKRSTDAQLAMYNDGKNRQSQNDDIVNWMVSKTNKRVQELQQQGLLADQALKQTLQETRNWIGTNPNKELPRNIGANDFLLLNKYIDMVYGASEESQGV